MKSINKDIILLEGAADISSIRVYCKDRMESLEFEKTMHDNGWTWSSGNKYLIRNDESLNNVTFINFNRSEKTFSGRKDKGTGDNVYEYSKDSFGLMNKILNKEPSYNPRKFNKTFEAFNKDTYQYGSVAFEIRDEEDLRKIVTYFHNNLKVESNSDLEWLIDDLKKCYNRRYERRWLLILFDKSLFCIMEAGEMAQYSTNQYKTNPNVFTVNDLYLFNVAPNYSPRRIERTLESVTHRFPYKEIGIKIVNEDELIEAQNNLKKIGELTKDLSYDIQVYPNYMFIDVWHYEDSKEFTICYLSDERDTEAAYQRLVVDDPSIYQYMFSLSEWKKVEGILKYGRENSIPSYKPKNFDKILESKDDYMYNRVVFEINNAIENIRAQESLFKLGYSWAVNGYEVVGFSSFPHYIFTPSTYDYRKNITHMYFDTGINSVDSYISKKNKEDRDNICPRIFKYNDVSHIETLLKYGRVVPSYEPKKMSRTLESVENIPYDRFVIVVRSEEESKRVQDVLFTNGKHWSNDDGYKYFRNYPQVIWVYFKTDTLSSSRYDEGEYSDKRILDYIGGQNKSGESINPDLFKASDVRFFDVIKKTGKIGPSYEPRKTDRNI